MHIAVIGAGWAGCAAAVTLARLGRRVTVIESAAVAGGRARRVVRAGLALDNGQHVLLGAYAQTRNLLAAVHGGSGDTGVARLPLCITPLARSKAAFELRARRLPAPLGLLAGLLAARGLTLRERLGLVRWFRRLAARNFRCNATATVAELVADGPHAGARELWGPLCLAALNTPPERASAQVFANVLRAAFASDAQSADFLLPATDLSSLLPDAAMRFVAANRGSVSLRTHARLAALPGDHGVELETGGRRLAFDGAIIAVGPHQLEDAVGEQEPFRDAVAAARGLLYEPLATLWLGYASPAPMPAPIVRLDDSPAQWLIDRPDIVASAAGDASRPALAQVVAAVISASGPHDAVEGQALAHACDAQLRRLAPAWPKLAWSQAIVERRATYACVPGRPRPASALPHPRVALAGDWLDAEYPATIEAAVRTGVAAAFALDDGLAAHA